MVEWKGGGGADEGMGVGLDVKSADPLGVCVPRGRGCPLPFFPGAGREVAAAGRGGIAAPSPSPLQHGRGPGRPA